MQLEITSKNLVSELDDALYTLEQRDRARLHHRRREVRVVARDVPERPRRGLLHAGVELLEALHEGIQGAGIHDRLREGGGVLRHRAEDERRGLFVEPVLLRERVHELGQDLVRDDRLREVVAVVREPPERDRGGLLDAEERKMAGGTTVSERPFRELTPRGGGSGGPTNERSGARPRARSRASRREGQPPRREDARLTSGRYPGGAGAGAPSRPRSASARCFAGASRAPRPSGRR